MARRERGQVVDFGRTRTVRYGAPSPFADAYYGVMQMGWPAFVGLVCVVFAAINLGFGLVYAALPGAIANARPGSLADGVFFSIDTLGTVGYGYMYPATHVAHAVASVEILIGLFFSATITGLIFARFARPRVGLAFSDCVVIGQYEGRRALMLRVVALRSQPLADADAQLSWLETVRHPDGTTYRRLTELPLARSRNPMLGLAWLLVHFIDDDSAMLAALESEERFLLTAMVRGTDTFLASPSLGAHQYDRDDVLTDREFVDMVTVNDGTITLDMRRLNETRPTGAGADQASASASA